MNRLASLVLFFLASLSLSMPSLAASQPVMVKALQMPAWYVRNGQSRALQPGESLHAGDFVKTAKGGRVLIRMEEGSLVKLGEEGNLSLQELKPAQEKDGFFQAALRVLTGAFRFTTTPAGRDHRRQISVSVGSITAGIRGTDIWGKASGERDLVCLIEGKISAQRTGEPSFTMQDPMTFYLVPKNQPAQPVSPVNKDQLAAWAAQTELLDGLGVVSQDGQWSVHLLSVKQQAGAEDFRKKLDRAGYGAQVIPAEINGVRWYRVTITHFASRKDAQAFAGSMDGRFGIHRPWVSKS